MKWFHKQNKEPQQIIITHGNLSVRHIIQKDPDPRPVMGWLIWTNQNGERWQSQPFQINGNSGIPIQIPIAWLTGREKDIAKLPLTMQLDLSY